MAANIDERIVEMQFDNEDFGKGVEDSLKTLDKLDQGLALKGTDKAVSGISDVSKSLSGLQNGFGLLDGAKIAVWNVASAFDRVKYAIESIAIGQFANKIISMGESLVKSMSVDQISAGWDKYAQKTSSVQTIMAATAKDFSDTGKQMEYVNGQLDKLMWFTDETSYNFVDMVDNIGKFTSQGISLEDSVTSMQGIATWAAISGGNAQQASRAMYNLSQAMGLGSVRLMDWRSIENAQMATQEFKETVLETAANMGTLTKTADGTYKTLKGTEVSIASFSSTLSEGWFTSDVLTSTLNEYGAFATKLAEATDETGMTATDLLAAIDDYAEGTLSIKDIVEETGITADRAKELFDELSSSTYDLGRRSFKAAQEAKTFSEAIEATKDAVSTQWMKTYEIIFGDYLEAKELWTGLANTLWDVFASGGEARNEALQEWRDMGGRDAALEAVSNAYQALASIVSVAKKAMDTIFTPMTSERLYEITDGVRNFTAALKDALWYDEKEVSITEEVDGKTVERTETYWKMSDALYQFRRILQGALSVVGIGIDLFKALANGALYAIQAIASKSSGLINAVAGLGDWLTNLRKYIQDNNVFGEFIDKLKPSVDAVLLVIRAISVTTSKLATEIFKDFNVGGKLSSAFSSFTRMLNTFVGKLPGYIIKFGAFVVGFIQKLRQTKVIQALITNFTTALTRIRNALAVTVLRIAGVRTFDEFFTKLQNGLTNAKEAIGKFISENDLFNKAINFIGTAFKTATDIVVKGIRMIGIGAEKIRTYLSESGIVGKAFESFKKVLESIKGFISPAVDSIKKFFTGLFESTDETGEVQSKFDKFIAKLQEIKTKVSDFFSQFTIFDSIVATFKTTFNSIKEILFGTEIDDGGKQSTFFDRLHEKISDFGLVSERIKAAFENIGNILKSAFGVVKGIFSKIIGVIKDLFSGVIDFAASKNLGIFDLLKGYFAAKGGVDLINAIGGFRGIAESVNSGIESITGPFKAIKDKINSLFKEQKSGALDKLKVLGDTILKAAASLLIIAGAIALIASIDPDRLWTSVAVIAAIGAGLVALIAALKAVAKDIASVKTISKLGTSIIKISAGLLILSYALTNIASLYTDQMVRGLIGLGGVMLELIAFMNLIPKGGTAKVSGLIGLALGILVLVQSVKQLSNLDTNSLIKGLAGVGALMLALAAFVKLTQNESKGLFKGGTKNSGFFQNLGLLAVVSSVLILVQAVKQLSNLDTNSLIKALAGVGALMLALAVFVKLTQNKSKGLFKGGSSGMGFMQSLGLIGAVASIMILIQGLKQLAAMNPESLVVSIVALGAVMLELATFSRLVTSNKGAFKSIGTGLEQVAIAGAMLLFVKSLETLTRYSFGDIIKAVVSMGLVMIEIGLFTKYLSKVKGGIKSAIGVIGIAAAMLLIAKALNEVAAIEFSGIVKALIAFGVVFISIAALTKVFSSAIKILPMLVSMLAVAAGLALVVIAIKALDNVGLENVLGIAAAISSMLIAIGVSFGILGTLGIAGAISAISSLAVAIAGITAIVLAAGAIGQIPGFNWLIGEGKNVLTGIGQAIGGFVGGIVGGALEALSSSLPGIGTNLSSFMTNSQGFFDGLTNIDESKVSAVNNLVSVIMSLTGAEIISGIGSFITGGTDVTSFGDKIKTLGDAVASFAVSVGGSVDESTATAAANVGNAVASLVSAIPEEGGWAQKITGEPDLEGFTAMLPILGLGIKTFGEAASGIDSEAASNASAVGGAIKSLVDAAPKEGGWAQKIAGETNLEGFAAALPILGLGIKTFGEAASGIDSEAASNASAVGGAIKSLVDAAPKEGGWAQKIAGETNLEGFAAALPILGLGIKTFGDSVTGIDGNAASNAAAVGGALKGIVDGIPPTDGWAQKLAGEQNIQGFADALPSLGAGIKAFGDSVVGLSADSASNAAIIGSTLQSLATGLPKEGGLVGAIFGSSGLGTFATDVEAFGEAIRTYASSISTFNDGDVEKSGKVIDMLKNLSTDLPKTGGLAAAIFGSSDLSSFSTTLNDFSGAIGTYSANISTVDTTKMDDVRTRIKDLVGLGEDIQNAKTNKIAKNIDTIVTGLTDQRLLNLINPIDYESNFVGVGNAFADYVAAGITAEKVTYTNAGQVVASAFIESIYPGSTSDANTVGSDISKAISDSILAHQESFNSAGKLVASALTSAISPGFITNATDAGLDISKAILEGFNSLESEIFGTSKLVGSKMIHSFSDGLRNQQYEVVSSSKDISFAAANSLASYKTDSIGMDFAKGYIQGMKSMLADVIDAAKNLGKSSTSALKSSIKSASPSKVAMQTGEYFGEGYLLGIESYLDKVYGISSEMGKISADGISASGDYLSSIYDALNINPVITPVLDLSEIESGNASINSIFGLNSIGLSGFGYSRRNAASLSAEQTKVQIDSGEIVTAVNRLGEKLEALGTDIQNMKLVMDTGVVAGQMVGAMDKELGKQAIYKGRGN